MTRVRITEYLDIDLEREMWCCNRCDGDLICASEMYKKGCLAYARDPRTVHEPLGTDPTYNYSMDPQWCLIVEFYCPHCGTMIENEYLPPGHPITYDIELDIKKLKEKHLGTLNADSH